jgi:hypothetical protein
MIKITYSGVVDIGSPNSREKEHDNVSEVMNWDKEQSNHIR